MLQFNAIGFYTAGFRSSTAPALGLQHLSIGGFG